VNREPNGNHCPVSQQSEHQQEAGSVLSVEPGLCGSCRHASVKETNRGTAYLRCTRAAWDDRLDRYPSLPRTDCVGFEAAGDARAASPGQIPPQPKGPRPGS
jgi:hypothetical protein